MRAYRLTGFLLLAAAGSASAHDFWIQPADWRPPLTEPVDISILVGHGPDRQRTPIQASRILRFDTVSANGRRTDLRGRLHMGEARSDATIVFDAPGAYLLVLETDDRAESHLPAHRFNDYLRAEGLTPAIDLRARTGRTDADGAENYSRHAKAIVQAGAPGTGSQAAVTRPAGMALEIVPEQSLLAAAGKSFTVRIYYHGRPLVGALVKLTNLDHDAEPVEMHRSGSDGRAVFAAPCPGNWQMNVIWTRPQQPDRLTDFETDFSSLSFSTEPEPRR